MKNISYHALLGSFYDAVKRSEGEWVDVKHRALDDYELRAIESPYTNRNEARIIFLRNKHTQYVVLTLGDEELEVAVQTASCFGEFDPTMCAVAKTLALWSEIQSLKHDVKSLESENRELREKFEDLERRVSSV